MAKRKKLLDNIDAKHKFIAQHQAKIDHELMKPTPDRGLDIGKARFEGPEGP